MESWKIWNFDPKASESCWNLNITNANLGYCQNSFDVIITLYSFQYYKKNDITIKDMQESFLLSFFNLLINSFDFFLKVDEQ